MILKHAAVRAVATCAAARVGGLKPKSSRQQTLDWKIASSQEMMMQSGERFKASDGTESIYTIMNVDGDSVQVLRQPHPTWAGPAWISVGCFEAVADLDSPLTTDL
jgi:hypothetical protein